jgi:hypothetical protein
MTIHFKRTKNEGFSNDIWHFRRTGIYKRCPVSFNFRLIKYYDEVYDKIDTLPMLSSIEYEKGEKEKLSFRFVGSTRCTEFWGARCYVGRLGDGRSFRFYLSCSDDFVSIDIPTLNDDEYGNKPVQSERELNKPGSSKIIGSIHDKTLGEVPQRKYYDPAYDSFCYQLNPYEIEIGYKRSLADGDGSMFHYEQCTAYSYCPKSFDVSWEGYYDPFTGRDELKPILSNVKYRSDYERIYAFKFDKYPAHIACENGEQYIAGAIHNLNPLFVGRRVIEFFGAEGCDLIRVKLIELGPELPATKWRDDD